MKRPWYETIFDERYPELFGPLEQDPEEEVAQIVGLIPIPPGAAVVDLGCGRGRHAIPLSRRGSGRTCGSSSAPGRSTAASRSFPLSATSATGRTRGSWTTSGGA